MEPVLLTSDVLQGVLNSHRKMEPLGLLIVLVCLLNFTNCSPHLRDYEERQNERWEHPSGDLLPISELLDESDQSYQTNNDHPKIYKEEGTGGVGGDPGRDSSSSNSKHRQYLRGERLPISSIPSPGEAGLMSSTMIKITGDPLQEDLKEGQEGSDLEDQRLYPNRQSQRRPVADVIQGSRRAFSITKLEYLKKEWCKTERFKQVIREEGCLKRVIINRFCYGQCNSFFIPKSNRNDPDSAAFKSCAFCRPRKSSNITVTLVCPNRRPRLKRKKVLVVKQCRCMAQALD